MAFGTDVYSAVGRLGGAAEIRNRAAGGRMARSLRRRKYRGVKTTYMLPETTRLLHKLAQAWVDQRRHSVL